MKIHSKLGEAALRESVNCECDFPSCPIHGTDPCPGIASATVKRAGIPCRVCEKCKKAYDQEMYGA